MPRYVIEREIPGAGKLSEVELRTVSAQSNGIIAEMGQGVTWLHSYVTDDKVYCVYDSPNAELIYEHARCLGTPANSVAEVRRMIGPETGRG
jgi:hypothetical protein